MFQRSQRETLLYFAIAFTWAWACWIPVLFLLKGDSFANLLTLLGTFGPLVSSLALSIYAGGRREAVDLLRQATRLKMSANVFCWSTVLPLVIASASWRLAGGTQVNNDAFTIATRFVLYLFFGGSVAEEFGWRGYAWPRLRERLSLSQASIVLGVLWAAWHLPLFFIPGTTQASTPFWAFALTCCAMSAIMGWCCEQQRSIVPALLFHTIWNLTTVIFPPFETRGVDPTVMPATILFVIAGAMLVIVAEQRPQDSTPANVR